MLFYLTVIFVCQLIGEVLVTLLHLPIPGPVIGMALLFAGLLMRGGIPDDLGTVLVIRFCKICLCSSFRQVSA